MIAGSFSVGVSFVYAKKFVAPLKLPAAALTTYQIGIAAITLAVLTDTAGIRAVFSDNRAWIGLVFGLGLCGTGLAYVAYYFIVEKLGAVTAASVTYLPPLVAIMIGLLVGEQLDGFDIAAIVLILTGVAVLQLATLRHKTVASRNNATQSRSTSTIRKGSHARQLADPRYTNNRPRGRRGVRKALGAHCRVVRCAYPNRMH